MQYYFQTIQSLDMRLKTTAWDVCKKGMMEKSAVAENYQSPNLVGGDINAAPRQELL